MDNQKVNINQYFVDYLMQNKALFGIYCLLLFTYPLHRVVLPKFYGKVISGLSHGLNEGFISNAKWLLAMLRNCKVTSTKPATAMPERPSTP